MRHLADAALPPRETVANIPANTKVRAALNNALGVAPDVFGEPFGEQDLRTMVEEGGGIDTDDVMSLVYPHDSVSQMGIQMGAARQQGKLQHPLAPAGRGARAGRGGARTATPTPKLNSINEYTPEQVTARVISVYMRTASGRRFGAKVDIEGLATVGDLLVGLRAAFVHYTRCGTPPPPGTLLITVVRCDGEEIALHEGEPSAALPAIGAVLPCSYIRMEGYESAGIASQQLMLLKETRAAGHR